MSTPSPSTAPPSAEVSPSSASSNSTSSASSTPPLDQKEESYNSYKLFVGQIPPFTSEEVLRSTFSPYGPISDVVILKDRHTGAHKGCGFVCFNSKASADMAIANLGDKVRLPNAKREMIVRYAGDRPDDKEHKLYVCMLSRQSTDQDVKALFEPFGQLTEVFIIRSREGNQSKGAAFVKFSNHDDAERAINAIHDKVKDKECPGLIQVRFAHTKEERAAHLSHVLGAPQQGGNTLHSMMGMNNNGNSRQGQGGNSMGNQQYSHSQLAAAAAAAAALGYGQMPSHLGKYNPNSFNMNAYGNAYGRPGGDFNSLNPGNFPTGFDGSPGQNSFNTGYGHPSASYPQSNSLGVNVGVGVSSNPSVNLGGVTSPNSKDPRGPEGANLFVYNIPEAYSEADLTTLFTNFGNVLSTRIQRDLTTGVSKGFGFVSYDDPNAAQSAINQLDGFAIGNKRLTVRLKTQGGHQHQHQHGGGSNININMGSNNGAGSSPGGQLMNNGGMLASSLLSSHSSQSSPHQSHYNPLHRHSSGTSQLGAQAGGANPLTMGMNSPAPSIGLGHSLGNSPGAPTAQHTQPMGFAGQNTLQQFRGY